MSNELEGERAMVVNLELPGPMALVIMRPNLPVKPTRSRRQVEQLHRHASLL